MYARVTIGGADRLRATIALRQQRASDLTVPLEGAGGLTRDAAVRRFVIGGDPAWVPSQKTRAVSFPTKAGGILSITGGGGQTGVDTGNLMRSIQVDPVIGNSVKIGTNVPYAAIFNFGSGIFGTGPRAGRTGWTVRPTSARVLAWSFGGRTYFAREVHLNGQIARPFMYIDQALADEIIALFRRDLAAA